MKINNCEKYYSINKNATSKSVFDKRTVKNEIMINSLFLLSTPHRYS